MFLDLGTYARNRDVNAVALLSLHIAVAIVFTALGRLRTGTEARIEGQSPALVGAETPSKAAQLEISCVYADSCLSPTMNARNTYELVTLSDQVNSLLCAR